MPRNKFKDKADSLYLEKCGYVCGWSQIIQAACVTQMYVFLDILSNGHSSNSITYLVTVSPFSTVLWLEGILKINVYLAI